MAQLDSTLTSELLHKLGKDIAGMRFLLVDRHTAARNSLRVILSTLGIKSIHGVGTSTEVVRQVRGNHFDVILSDYHLDDGRDGQQLLEELRQQHLISLSTVFIVITAERGYHNVVSVAELAPDDYLIKPFTGEQLQARLARAVYKKQFFAAVFEQLDRGAFVEALGTCEKLLGLDNFFLYDTLRFKGEILNALGRYDEAKAVYQQVLESSAVPWARMGLAIALRGQEKLADAETIATELIADFPEFLAAYDFVAGVREEMGRLPEAQAILQQAAGISPNNSARQRMVGDIALRNNDLTTAERAYERVLTRHRGSSLRTIDDYTNLSRTLIDNGRLDGARKVTQDLRRDWRGSKQGELAACVMDSLCAGRDGDPGKAKEALTKALVLHNELQHDDKQTGVSQQVAVDLAHACLATGATEEAQDILAKVAAENHEDRGLIARIETVFAKTGSEEAGKNLLDRINREIVELNNRGVLAARSGDLEASVAMLVEAAQRVPNLQFLVNASKAIFTLLDRNGWNAERAELGLRFLEAAHAKEARNPKVVSARELYQHVARKFGVEPILIGGRQAPGEKPAT